MKLTRNDSNNHKNPKRTMRHTCAILTLLSMALIFGAGCDEEEAFRAFRDAASSNLQSGAKTAMDGIIDGLFAVFEQGTGGSSTTDSTTDSTTN